MIPSNEFPDMQLADLDTRRRFVRVTGTREPHFVEFDFAVGEPELFVEMILDQDAFAEFCLLHQVEVLPSTPFDSSSEPQSDWDWRLADATQTRFKQ
ncbi:TPA: phenol hydroxylase subunit [Pseudomonas aeruginosa]